MKLEKLLDMENLLRMVGEGMIRERVHPDHPTLRTLGYTEAAQWSRTWNNETLTCRGLIYEARSGEVLARPYRKFFNHQEHTQEGMEPLPLDEPVEVTDKMDGSLGILYRNPFTGEWAVATRGSFDSDQARLANDQFLPRILEGVSDVGVPAWLPIDGFTYLAEIIDPSNRIVLDYGRTRGLALLGGVHVESGRTVGPDFDPFWPDLRAETFRASTLGDALALPPRPNAEGLVVRYLRPKTLMAKIKQEDYVRLHKIITGLSDKAVWEHLAEGGTPEAMAADVPDEFHGWLDETFRRFTDAYTEVEMSAAHDYDRVVHEVERVQGLDPEDPAYRKAFALEAKETERPALLFARLIGKPLAPMIWKELRPVGVRYMSGAAKAEALA